MPPSLIIKNGKRRITGGILLWDSPEAEIFFSEKNFPDFTKSDFSKAIGEFNKY